MKRAPSSSWIEWREPEYLDTLLPSAPQVTPHRILFYDSTRKGITTVRDKIWSSDRWKKKTEKEKVSHHRFCSISRKNIIHIIGYSDVSFLTLRTDFLIAYLKYRTTTPGRFMKRCRRKRKTYFTWYKKWRYNIHFFHHLSIGLHNWVITRGTKIVIFNNDFVKIYSRRDNRSFNWIYTDIIELLNWISIKS